MKHKLLVLALVALILPASYFASLAINYFTITKDPYPEDLYVGITADGNVQPQLD